MIESIAGSAAVCAVAQPRELSPLRERKMARLYLRRKESLTTGVPRLIVEHLDDALRALRGEGCDLREGVHRARTTCKKVRAILRFVEPALEEETFERHDELLREASARLSALRDAHVQLHVLGTIEELAKAGNARFPQLRAILERRAQAEEARCVSGDDSLRATIADLQAARAELAGVQVRHSFASIEKGIRQTYRAGRRGLRALTSDPTLENHHEWRKQVKYLRYQAAILQAIWPAVMKTLARELRTLSEWLGDARDMAILEERLASDAELAAVGEEAAALRGLLARQRKRLDRRCIPAGQRLYADRSRLFASRIESWWEAAHPQKARK